MKPQATAIARVRLAEAELATAEREFMKSALPWRQRLHRHRNALNLASGFAAGLALTLLPSRWWAGVGAAVGKTAASSARSPLAPAILGAVLSHLLQSQRATRETAPPADIESVT